METAPRAQPRRRWTMPIVLGGAAAFALTLGVWLAFRGERIPLLTSDALDAAQRRWQKLRPRDYDLDLEITGTRAGRVHVEVRDGRVHLMQRDGQTPAQSRTWDVWTVDGQFDTIADDQQRATQGETNLILRGEFDAELGYPRRYQVSNLTARNDYGWRTTRLVPVRPAP